MYNLKMFTCVSEYMRCKYENMTSEMYMKILIYQNII